MLYQSEKYTTNSEPPPFSKSINKRCLDFNNAATGSLIKYVID